MARWSWVGAGMATVSLSGYLGYHLESGDRSLYLPGKTSHGHYQIEMKCDACHGEGGGVRSERCLDCHREELERADDSHPPSKFVDPRNAALVAKLDATACVTCHTEHRPVLTDGTGVTLPQDYCFYCHQDVAKDRSTHAGLDHQSCQDGGCHNFHDNLGLHEDYLERHLDEPWLHAAPLAPVAGKPSAAKRVLTRADADLPAGLRVAEDVFHDWAASAHARAGVNCSDCHGAPRQWVDAPALDRCERCHALEVGGFLGGHHGMRLAQGLSAMTPAQSRLAMKPASAQRALGCQSCHGAHAYDTRRAAVDACVACHADEHTESYARSGHALAWREEERGRAAPGSGVSCARCHMPRVPRSPGAQELFVQHNQNDNLRPNEKMLRTVCTHCHGVEFALSALADPSLVRSNYRGQPSQQVPSLRWVKQRREERVGAD